MSIVVVGDVLLDVDLDGRSERLSPEGPVPVVEVTTSTVRAGGAGLVATLLAGDGADVQLVTALADDARSADLRDALTGVRTVAGISPSRTPVKTRVRSSDHLVTRLDEDCGPPVAPRVTPAMLDAIAGAEAIVVADYGRGIAADPSLRAALDNRRPSIPLVWDPHPRGARPVASTTVVTPNLAEAALFARMPVRGVASAADAGAALGALWGCESVVVTLAQLGAVLVPMPPAGWQEGRSALPLLVPATPVSAADACGAGDRFAASLGLALARGAGLTDAVGAAVHAAGAFLAAGGVTALGRTVAPSSTAGAADAGTARLLAERVRAAGGTVVATGGCFDLLHAGHARTLASARRLGDCLIVCVNSDESVRRLKGEHRPILAQQDRIDLLLALECVDAVLVFDEDTPEAALGQIRPDLWVKGGDYAGVDLPESALVRSWGGRSVTVPYVAARSTTLLAGALSRVG